MVGNRDMRKPNAARTRRKHRRWAEEMRRHGWTVIEPEEEGGQDG